MLRASLFAGTCNSSGLMRTTFASFHRVRAMAGKRGLRNMTSFISARNKKSRHAEIEKLCRRDLSKSREASAEASVFCALFSLWRRGLGGFVLIVPARQVSGLHADLAGCHVVILRLGQPLQIFIEPPDNMLKPLHAMPRLS